VGAAERTGARPAVLHVLRRLPMGPFHDLRQLWPALPGVPIEPEPANRRLAPSPHDADWP
jgi:hypothetical protein